MVRHKIEISSKKSQYLTKIDLSYDGNQYHKYYILQILHLQTIVLHSEYYIARVHVLASSYWLKSNLLKKNDS